MAVKRAIRSVEAGATARTERRAAQLAIEVFGNFAVKIGTSEILLGNRKSRAVVGYLALSDRPREARERLVGLLWSDSEEEKARGSLRTTLHEIRGAFHAAGYEGMLTDKLQIGLRPEGLDVDVKAVLAEARAGRPHRLLLERERLFEQLLAGFEDLDPAFRSWLLPKRQALQDRVLRDLEMAMRDESVPQTRQEALARAIVNLDPTHEEAARTLIRIRYAEGDIGGALGTYKRLWDVLTEEFGEEPLPVTKELIAKIKLAQDGSDTHSSSPGALRPAPILLAGSQQATSASRLTVTLGTFDAAAVPLDSRYLVQEFRRELIASLVRFREWVVRDEPAGPQSSGVPPDHEVVLDGGAYLTKSGVRLVLTLRDPASGSYLWSEKLDISPMGWWASQQSVVQRMASALNVHISAGRLATIARKSEASLSAYDLWLQGQATMRSFHEADWHKAADIFRNLMSRVPLFAPSYSSLAQLHNSIHVSHYGVFRDQQRRDEALQCAREAVRLDPADSRGLLSLGWSYLMAEQFQQAVINFELAIELNENDPWTMISAALGFAFSGGQDTSLALVEKARTLSPALSAAHWGYESRVFALAGRYERAAQALAHAAQVPALPAWSAVIFAHLDRMSDAREKLELFYGRSQSLWSGAVPWSKEAAIKWFLHAFPIKSEKEWERLQRGLQLAGAPVPGLRHRFWDVKCTAY